MLLAGALLWTGCEKELQPQVGEAVTEIAITAEQMPKVEVRNGMLYFETSEQFSEVAQKVVTMTDTELDRWEKQIGFTSIHTVSQKAMDKVIEVVKTADEASVYKEVERYKNWVTIKEDENYEKELVFVFDDPFKRRICNEIGIYQIKETFFKPVGDFMVSSSDINRVMAINTENIELLQNSTNEIKQYKYRNVLKTGCGTYTEGSVEKNVSGCSNDRRVKVSINTYMEDSPSTTDLVVALSSIHVWGQAKSGFSCIYFNYETVLTLEAAEYTVTYPTDYSIITGITEIGQEHVVVPKKIATGKEIIIRTELSRFYDDFSYGYYTKPYFNSFKVSATSQGVDGRYATISCGM